MAGIDNTGLEAEATDKLSLNDLQQKDYSLDDLSTNPLLSVTTGTNSNAQLAMNTALVNQNPEQAETVITAIEEEITTEGSSETQKLVAQMATEATFGAVQDSLVDVLLDDSISDEDKLTISTTALDKTSELFSLRNNLSVSQLSKDSGVIKGRENPEQERVRGNFAKLVNQTNEVKRQQQALLNQRAAVADASTETALADFIESVFPFSKSSVVADVLEEFQGDSTVSSRTKALFTLGQSVEELQETLKSVPLEDRHRVSQALADIIDNNTAIVLPDTNDFMRVDLLRTFLEEGYYGDTEKWIDTVVGILDVSILGGPLVRLLKKAKGGRTSGRSNEQTEEAFSKMRKRSITDGDYATAPANNVADVNPDSARAMFEGSVQTSSVAKALHGTDSAHVAAKEINPDVIVNDGSVRAKPSHMHKNSDMALTPDPDAIDFVKVDGSIYYTEAEKRQLRGMVVTDFEKAVGIRLRDNVTQVGRDNSDGITVKAVYAPSSDTGWEHASDAIEQTMFALRKYGLTENDIEVLSRAGDEYVRVADKSELSLPHDYVVSVKYDYKFNPLDVVEWGKKDVNYNIFDRTIGQVKLGQVSLSKYIKDATSLFSKEIAHGALRAADLSAAVEKTLIEVAKDFDEKYLKLSDQAQAKLYEYIKEANHRGLKFDETSLHGRGYNGQEIEALRSWKKYWDTQYTLENADMTHRLNAQGWQLWSPEGSNLVVRPVARNNIGDLRKFYDSETDSIVRVDNQRLRELYDQGGTVVEIKSPFKIGDQEVTHAVVPQSTKNYSRRIREEDHILNYRDGYYSVNYKAPIFIDRVIKDHTGKTVRTETVAYSGTRKDAEFEAARLAQQDGGEYNIRFDKTVEDDYLEVSISQGRSSQRFRGERLREATAVSESSEQFIMDPVETMIHSARSISQRVAYRDYLEATKQQFMKQFEDHLPKEKGVTRYPTKIEDIQLKDLRLQNDYQDAKATWEYLNYLENGYINAMDDFFKSSMRKIADVAGTKSRTAEKAFRGLSEVSPTGFGKNIAFQAYLATNPLRQFVVQSHQAVQLAGLDPVYAVSKLPKEASALVQYKLGHKNVAAKIFGVSRAEMDEIARQMDASGLLANVDRHSLVSGSLTQMADAWSYGSKGKRVASTLWGIPRKAGFDAGEMANMMTAWLTMRHRAIKTGKDMSKAETQAAVAANARDFTYAMNVAGDLPYNQNSAALILQFMQVPHKAMLQMLSNRSLTKGEKARMAAFNLTMYSLPPVAMYNLFGGLLNKIENEEVRDAVVFGLESTIMNAALSGVVGEDTRIDFSGMAPTDMYGFYETLTTFWTEGIGESLANAPSASLFLGHNPRITDAFKGAARFFNVYEDGIEAPEDFWKVMQGFASISSGYSNYLKASMAIETGNKLSSSGRLIEVTKGESYAALFGFQTIEETQRYLSGMSSYAKSKEFEEDFQTWYQGQKRVLAKDGISSQDSEFNQRIYNQALRHFKKHPERFNDLLFKALANDVKSGDFRYYEAAQRMMGIQSFDEFNSWIQSSPMPDEVRKDLSETMRLVDEARQKQIQEDK
jgi:hypothetical protein